MSHLVFEDKLTALRYPERERVRVPAIRTWCEPIKPLAGPVARTRDGRVLDVEDVLGKRVIKPRLDDELLERPAEALGYCRAEGMALD